MLKTICLCCFLISLSLSYATPFDAQYRGESSVYVSIRDDNHKDIWTDGNRLSYRDFQRYNNRYVKDKKQERYVFQIENYGTTQSGTLLGSMKITRSKDGKVLADYDFKANDEYPNRSTSNYEIDAKTGWKQMTKMNIVDPAFPHRRIICRAKGSTEDIEWLIFYPALIDKKVAKTDLWEQTGHNSIILYCPKLGFIDLVGRDNTKTKTKMYTELDPLRKTHPMAD